MMKNKTYRLYYFAGAAFILALAKYFFVGDIKPEPRFFVFEFVSFALFLGLVYFFDKFVRESIKQKSVTEEIILQSQNESKNKIEQLQKLIAELKDQKHRKASSNDEISKVALQITAGLKKMAKPKDLAKQLLINIAAIYEVGLGVCYFYDKPSDKFTVKATYGLSPDINPKDFTVGEGLNGQAVADKKCMLVADIDEDYFPIESGSGQAKPNHIYLLPIIKDDVCIGLIEIASFAHVYMHKHWEQLNNSIVKAMTFKQ